MAFFSHVCSCARATCSDCVCVRSKMRSALWLAGLALYFGSACSSAQGALIPINFDDLVRGTKVNNQYVNSKGVTISCDNFTAGHPDQAIIFDSNNHTSNVDTDLQFPW